MEISDISETIGWINFFLWSISFYFQLYDNYRYKSGEGYSFDFQLFNIIGFLCLSLNYIFHYFENDPTIHLNDICFGLHAFCISLIITAQTLFYPLGKNKLSKTGIFGSLFSFTFIILYAIFSLFIKNQVSIFEFIGMNKVIISTYKYVVQIGFNYRRKSTFGWSTGNTILDLIGGTLTLVQIIVDINDPKNKIDYFSNIFKGTKFLLGNVVVFFDIILLLQRYVFYKENHNTQLKVKEKLIN